MSRGLAWDRTWTSALTADLPMPDTVPASGGTCESISIAVSIFGEICYIWTAVG